jgi:hypothetical protein
VTSEDVLDRWARERPETPFVFFRGRRGHFRWLSYAAARAIGPIAGSAPGPEEWAPPEVGEIIAASRASGPGLDPALLPPAPAGERDVWISWRPLEVREEAALAGFAIRSGAAILAERSDRLPVGLFVWARPTIVSAAAAELEAVLAGIAAEAPRFLRRRWLRQRVGRLRLVLVEGEAGAAEVERIHRRLQELLPGAAASVRPFPPAFRAPA